MESNIVSTNYIESNTIVKPIVSSGFLSVCVSVHLSWSRLSIPQTTQYPAAHSIVDPHQLSGSVSLVKYTPELSGLKSILSTVGFTSGKELSSGTDREIQKRRKNDTSDHQ